MPLAYWCVLIAALMPIPLAAYAKAGSGGDNHDPRDIVPRLAPPKRRAHAAHLNAFESFPFFAAAVIIAITSGAPTGLVNGLSVLYVVLRIGYCLLYIGDRPSARSLVFGLAWAVNIAVFVLPAVR